MPTSAKSKPKGVRGKYFKKVMTYHEGANDERTATLAKVRRMRKISDNTALELLEAWLLSRDLRYKNEPGGL